MDGSNRLEPANIFGRRREFLERESGRRLDCIREWISEINWIVTNRCLATSLSSATNISSMNESVVFRRVQMRIEFSRSVRVVGISSIERDSPAIFPKFQSRLLPLP